MAEDDPSESSVRRARFRSLIDPRAASGRMLASIGVGALASCLTPAALSWRARAVFGWDAAAMIYTVLAWILILRASATDTRRRAALEDPGRHLVSLIALAASAFSLFVAIVLLRRIPSLASEHAEIATVLGLAAVALSWLVTHTSFTLRYAHLYYAQDGQDAKARCFDFPGRGAPADIDFAYFAFTVGMTFQVSDVMVTTTVARRAVLLHSVISFVYNTAILALALNLVASMFR